jgi:hypothetical protein
MRAHSRIDREKFLKNWEKFPASLGVIAHDIGNGMEYRESHANDLFRKEKT